MSILDIQDKFLIDNSIVDAEYHSHQSSNTVFDYNDEIRISVEGDRPTLPSKSYLYVEGQVVNAADSKPIKTVKFVNNGVTHLFSEIRYEINGITIDSTSKPGPTSTIKGYISHTPTQAIKLQNAGWKPDEIISSVSALPYNDDGTFRVCIPLSALLGFAEDYKKIILNIRQELVLIRSSSDDNALFHATDKGKVVIRRLLWKLPHIVANLQEELALSKYIERNIDTHVAFRSWELHTLKDIPRTTSLSWNIKSVKKSQSPLYVILAFQAGRDGKLAQDTSHYDDIYLTNVRVFLNSIKYPYDNLNENIGKHELCTLYDMYARFQESYYEKESEPLLSLEKFSSRAPIVVIDCSKQPESIAYQTQSVNVRVELDAHANIKNDVTAFCLLIYERQFTYNALTKYVKPL